VPIRKGSSSRGALLDCRVHDILRNEGSQRSGAQGHHYARGSDDGSPEAHLSSARRAGRGNRIFRRATTKTGEKRTDCRIRIRLRQTLDVPTGHSPGAVVQPVAANSPYEPTGPILTCRASADSTGKMLPPLSQRTPGTRHESSALRNHARFFASSKPNATFYVALRIKNLGVRT
jgi:hypothetical protein